MREDQIGIETKLQLEYRPREDFTKISGASNCDSEVENNCTCECERDCPINVLAKSETRVNLLVALHRQHNITEIVKMPVDYSEQGIETGQEASSSGSMETPSMYENETGGYRL
jgi:hypothetical protein